MNVTSISQFKVSRPQKLMFLTDRHAEPEQKLKLWHMIIYFSEVIDHLKPIVNELDTS